MSKSAIVYRLGGLGDILIITPVAKELRKRGYEVDACFGSPTTNVFKLLGNLNLYRKIYSYSRFPATNMDVFVLDNGDAASVDMLKPHYDLVVDYKFSIELNSHYREQAQHPGKEWMVSQNSNYMNWVDMMFAWAGIDPASIADDDKRPMYKVEPEEDEWAKKLIRWGKPDLVVVIQPNASSLVRTWYHPQQLPRAITEAYPEKNIQFIVWDGNQWVHLKGKHVFPIKPPENMDPVRASAAVVNNCDLFIGADSGFVHVAEALEIPHIAIYTTVPAWTRNKYYKYEAFLEPIGNTFGGVQCRPCFMLDRYCPRIREKAISQLSEREARIKQAMERNENPAEIAIELQTTQPGLMQEANLLQQRFNALIEQQAPCSLTITTDRIMEVVRTMI